MIVCAVRVICVRCQLRTLLWCTHRDTRVFYSYVHILYSIKPGLHVHINTKLAIRSARNHESDSSAGYFRFPMLSFDALDIEILI